MSFSSKFQCEQINEIDAKLKSIQIKRKTPTAFIPIQLIGQHVFPSLVSAFATFFAMFFLFFQICAIAYDCAYKMTLGFSFKRKLEIDEWMFACQCRHLS